MGVRALIEPLLGQKQNGGEKEYGDFNFAASTLEKGVAVPQTEKLLQANENVPVSTKRGKASFCQTTMNCVNVLLGTGMLVLPLTLQEGGWLSLSILFGFAVICWYTGVLLGRCVKGSGRAQTYLDIGESAFGPSGRVLVTILLCLEVAAYSVGNTIAMGDNLVRIFPDAGLDLPSLGIRLEPFQLLVTIAILVILPTTWLRDMSSLSFVSVGGVFSSIVVMAAVAYTGVFGGVGFHHSPALINIWDMPMVVGIYAFCYGGHVVLPTIYNGMENPAKYNQALIAASLIAFVVFGGISVLGAMMFGDDTQAEVTLNIPRELEVTSSIALWTTVLTPLSKFALGLAPLSQQIESLLPYPVHSKTHLFLGTSMRTLLSLSFLGIAVALPSFHNVLALSGSSASMTMAITFPALFYLKINWRSLTRTDLVCTAFCIVVGVVMSVLGTVQSYRTFVEKMNG